MTPPLRLTKILDRLGEKADTPVIEQLCQRFGISAQRDLPMYLLNGIDSATLFTTLLEIIEPFAQMLQEIYTFLTRHWISARASQYIIIGENAQNQVKFDIEAFPKIYKAIRIYQETHVFSFDRQKIVNRDISPLFLTEALLNCGSCTDP